MPFRQNMHFRLHNFQQDSVMLYCLTVYLYFALEISEGHFWIEDCQPDSAHPKGLETVRFGSLRIFSECPSSAQQRSSE